MTVADGVVCWQESIDKVHDISSLKLNWNVITSLSDLVPLASVAESK